MDLSMFRKKIKEKVVSTGFEPRRPKTFDYCPMSLSTRPRQFPAINEAEWLILYQHIQSLRFISNAPKIKGHDEIAFSLCVTLLHEKNAMAMSHYHFILFSEN